MEEETVVVEETVETPIESTEDVSSDVTAE